MWIGGVDHHRFDRFVQQGFWMVYQVGVQGIVACHQQQITGPVRRHLRYEARIDLGQPMRGAQCCHLRATPRPDEGERARAFLDKVGQQPRRLGTDRAAHRRPVLAGNRQQGRLPQGDRAHPVR
ncbi:Uncharacterised protein [Mycobacteroides abscessus subsp. abscessus]|nr:Uncharacterised protein [Mycobacteroides abscessus subsp. abscessus]